MAKREVKETTPQKPQKPEYYCEAVAIKNWECDLNGTHYKFKKGDKVKILEKWHYEKLTDKHIGAVR